MDQAPVWRWPQRYGTHQSSLALEIQGRGDDQSSLYKIARHGCSVIESQRRLVSRKISDALSYQQTTEIAVRREFTGRNASDSWMFGQIDSVRNDGCRGIGGGSRFGENGHCIGGPP